MFVVNVCVFFPYFSEEFILEFTIIWGFTVNAESTCSALVYDLHVATAKTF